MKTSIPGLLPRQRWTRSIRFQVSFWYVLTAAIILLVIGSIVYFAVRSSIIQVLDQKLSAEASSIDQRLQPEEENGDTSDKPDIAGAMTELLGGSDSTKDTEQVIRIISPSTSTIVCAPGIDRQSAMRALESIAMPSGSKQSIQFAGADEERSLRVLTRHVSRTPYILQVAVSWDASEDLLLHTVLIIVSVTCLFLLLSAIGAWLLVGRCLRPIDQIVSSAERLGGDHFQPELLPPPASSDDEVGHLVSALNRMMARLHDSFERQRQFTADASHELRTPLTILQGEMELTLSRDRSADEYRRVIQSGLEETHRLSKIVDNLGTLARGDAASGSYQGLGRTAFNFGALCRDVVTTFQLAAAGLQLKCEVCDNEVTVTGNTESLRRLIANLVQNAIAYTPLGGCVSVAVTTSEETVRLTVTDNGVGIAPQDLAHIFERFYRADKSRLNTGGAGLGLSIVESIAHAHGGYVSVESALGVGSTFVVTLPRD